jgi:hypothetical protein
VASVTFHIPVLLVQRGLQKRASRSCRSERNPPAYSIGSAPQVASAELSVSIIETNHAMLPSSCSDPKQPKICHELLNENGACSSACPAQRLRVHVARGCPGVIRDDRAPPRTTPSQCKDGMIDVAELQCSRAYPVLCSILVWGCNVMVACAGLARHWAKNQAALGVNRLPLSRNHGSNSGAGCTCR